MSTANMLEFQGRRITIPESKLWFSVEYGKGQEPYLLVTGELKTTQPNLIALSPDGRAVAIASKANIYCFCGITGQLDYEFQDVHTCKFRLSRSSLFVVAKQPKSTAFTFQVI